MAQQRKPRSNRDRLLVWARRNVFTERDEGRFRKIVVKHLISSRKSTGEEIGVWNVPTKIDDDKIVEIADDILNQLEIEVTQLAGLQKYACYAYFEHHERHINRCILSVAGLEDEENDDGMLSEGPEPRGQIMQLQRHLEATNKIFMGSVAQIMNNVTRSNSRLMETNEFLMKERGEMQTLVVNSLNEQKKIAAEERTEEMKANALREGMNIVKTLGPVVINKALGKQVFPETVSGVVHLGKTFFGGLDDSTIKQLRDVLGEARFMQFVSMGDAFHDAPEDAKGEDSETEVIKAELVESMD